MYNQTIQFPRESGHQYITTRRTNVATFCVCVCAAQKPRIIFAFLKGYIRKINATDTACGSQCLLSGPYQSNCASPDL